MAFPTQVNEQITDAVTQANTKVLGDAPAVAMGNLYQATSQALSNAAHNATSSQQQATITAQAATTMGVSTLYSLDTAATGIATKEIFGAARTSSAAAVEVSPENVVGYVQTLLGSPAGKSSIKFAAEQANQNSESTADESTLRSLKIELEGVIDEALKHNVSKQQVCNVLHQVTHDLNISMLYPFNAQGSEIKETDVEDYYHAIIAASRVDTAEIS